MFKMEIEIDKEIIEKNDFDFDYSVNILCSNLKKAGFLEELNENGRIIYRGTDSPKDFAYMGKFADALVKQQWFKNACKKWLLLSNSGSEDGSFYVAGDWVENFKKENRW